MPVNQVYKATGEKIIDISDSTVTAANMAQGVTAYDASGAKITGSMQGGLELNVKFTAGNKTISNYMFYNNHGQGSTNSTYPIEEVVIGDGVTSIGTRAFHQCTYLKSITMPNSVTSIGDDAFYGCSGLTSITIPNSVTSIGSWAFYGCSGLTSITIPNSVTSIVGHTFYGCSGLTSATIGNGVTSIRSDAFSGCSKLTTITIDKPQGSVSGAPWGATNATVVWTG